MKLISESRKRWLERARRKAETQIVRRRRRQSAARRRQPRIPTWSVWTAPELFSLNGPSRDKLLRKISSLRRKMAAANGRPLMIDFSGAKKLAAAGTLLFSAELRRLCMHFPDTHRALRCRLGKNNKVQQVLKQVGLTALLGRRGRVIPCDDDVIYWKFTHGTAVEGPKFEEVIGDISPQIAGEIQTELYEGFIEAMNNACHHAYIARRDDGLNLEDSRQWWMFSQLKDEQLTVVFCDLGVGIPATLPLKKPKLWKSLLTLGSAPKDAEAIEYALQDSVSRMAQQGRGMGLGQLVDVVRQTENGVAAILSNRGRVEYRRDGSIKVKNYSNSINGTLIHWTLPILRDAGGAV